MTPEGRVKAAVDRILKVRSAYFHKPVPHGFGSPCLDYHVACHGMYAAIEAKASPMEHPTLRQTTIMKQVRDKGGTVFLIDNVDGLDIHELDDWLAKPSVGFISTAARDWLAKEDA